MLLVELLHLALIGWLPGLVLYRLPYWDRRKRAGLDAEERLFWSIVLSLGISLAIVLALAAAGRYSFERLLLANALLTLALAAAGRFRLALGEAAPRPRWTALLPLALVLLGVWRFVPPAEYVIGGKDPGVYVNEGIVIAQRGTLVYRDPAVATVPAFARDQFFPSHERTDYYSVRFMGFWIRDPDTGSVVGQFPHLFPASIAIGYGLHGLSGARLTVVVWAVLGLVAVYFVARRLAGTPVAVAAAGLLALHPIQVWFGRYPNAEVVMQTLLFAAVLASARAHADEDGFFAPVAGLLLGLLLFLRFDSVLGVAGVLAALVLVVLGGGRVRFSLFVVLAGAAGLAAWYYAGPMSGYAYLPIVFLSNLRPWHYGALAGGATLAVLVLAASRRWPKAGRRVVAPVPALIAMVLIAGAGYALFLREPAGKLTDYDAYALRIFTEAYATLPALLAGLVGLLLASRQGFWRLPELFTTTAVFSLFFFYKIRIVPEHFWMARRFLPVILPALLIFVAVTACWGLGARGLRRVVSVTIGAVFLWLLASHYARAAAPIVDHVEYAGIIPKLEQLQQQIADRDLVVVESRDASDIHVLGLPLAYIYARHVLVLNTPVPDKAVLGLFLEWSRTQYDRVLFLGSGGTDLISTRWSARPIASERFTIPEYETAPFDAYPRGPRPLKVDYALYELAPTPAAAGPLDLDVGAWDDLHLVRFHAKEESDGRSMRWTRGTSYISIPPTANGSTITLWMSDGGRVNGTPPAEVTLYFGERPLGSATVTTGFMPYSFPLPPELRTEAAANGARLRLAATVWNPHAALGTGDDRELGVMVDRIRIH